jgi:hypothetical protein
MFPPKSFEVSERNVYVNTKTYEGQDFKGDGAGPGDFIYTP